MSIKTVRQMDDSSLNSGWDMSFNMGTDMQVEFLSLQHVMILGIPEQFTPVGGDNGSAPIYNYTGDSNETFYITVSPQTETPTETKLTITGGSPVPRQDPGSR